MARDRRTRRAFLAGSAALLGAGVAPALGEAFCTDDSGHARAVPRTHKPLGRINDRVGWGVALGGPALYDPALLEALASEQPNFLAIANALKFGDCYPNAVDVSQLGISGSWQACDDIVALAKGSNIPIRGDALAWNDWLPVWLKTIAREGTEDSRNRLRLYFRHHFETVFAHLALARQPDGAPIMRWCGVVNEPFNPWMTRDGIPPWRTGPWLDAFGMDPQNVPGYIGAAFDLGHRFRDSTQTMLFLNEANCENDHFGPDLRPAMLRLVDALQTSGRHVDAVGLECHLNPAWMRDPDRPDWTPFVSFIKDLAARGMKVFLTELDVIDCSRRSASERDAMVARYMSSLLDACLGVPAVDMVTNWDFSDRYSWLRDAAVYPNLSSSASCLANPPCPRPDLYDQAMQPKEARQALASALTRAPEQGPRF